MTDDNTMMAYLTEVCKSDRATHFERWAFDYIARLGVKIDEQERELDDLYRDIRGGAFSS